MAINKILRKTKLKKRPIIEILLKGNRKRPINRKAVKPVLINHLQIYQLKGQESTG